MGDVYTGDDSQFGNERLKKLTNIIYFLFLQCVTTESFFQDLLALSWRCKLTTKIQSKYFKGNNIQLILHHKAPLDNP